MSGDLNRLENDMTEPAVRTFNKGGGRFYADDLTGTTAPSVTSITGCLPKKALQFWSAKMVAQCAVEEFGTLASMVSTGNPTGAIDYLKRAPGRSSGVAAKTGSDVHLLCERIGRGEDPRVHPDLVGFTDNYRKFIREFEVKFLEVEVTAWSDTHGYAGTLDSIVMLDDEVVILDIKTGASGIWPDVALQLCAYARADCLLAPNGERRPLPQIDAAAALHLRPDGYSLIPIRIGDDVFDTFLALKEIASWEREVSKTVIGKSPVTPSTETGEAA